MLPLFAFTFDCVFVCVIFFFFLLFIVVFVMNAWIFELLNFCSRWYFSCFTCSELWNDIWLYQSVLLVWYMLMHVMCFHEKRKKWKEQQHFCRQKSECILLVTLTHTNTFMLNNTRNNFKRKTTAITTALIKKKTKFKSWVFISKVNWINRVKRNSITFCSYYCDKVIKLYIDHVFMKYLHCKYVELWFRLT